MPVDTDRQPNENQDDPVEKKQERKLDKFFEGPWNDWVFKLRFLIIGVFLIWGIIAAFYAG